jgi:predicted membrane protein
LTLCKLNVCTCSLVPCSSKEKNNQKTKKPVTNLQTIKNFFFALLAFQLLQVIMQIRFATMGKKNKHERNPKKRTEKVWNPKKEKNHKIKRQICKHVFLGFALLSSALGDYANQICIIKGREEKKTSAKP